MTLGGGWTCAQCGIFVALNNSHTCRSVAGATVRPIAPFPTYSASPRKYRITGKISTPGRSYAVDLVVEALP